MFSYPLAWISMIRMKKGLTKDIRPNIDFMRVGLSNVDRMISNPTSSKTSESSSKDGKNEPWQLYRFSTILKMLNHTTVRCVLISSTIFWAIFLLVQL